MVLTNTCHATLQAFSLSRLGLGLGPPITLTERTQFCFTSSTVHLLPRPARHFERFLLRRRSPVLGAEQRTVEAGLTDGA